MSFFLLNDAPKIQQSKFSNNTIEIKPDKFLENLEISELNSMSDIIYHQDDSLRQNQIKVEQEKLFEVKTKLFNKKITDFEKFILTKKIQVSESAIWVMKFSKQQNFIALGG